MAGRRTMLAAVAVLGKADKKALAFMLDGEPSTDQLAELLGHPAITCEEDHYILSSDVASELLATLQRTDLHQYRLLHERAMIHLSDRLRSGEGSAESTWQHVFERLANRLLADDPEAFSALMEMVEDVPLRMAATRQRRRYFQAVALRRSERYGDALLVFDTLLADPELDLTMRARTLNSRAVCYRLIGKMEMALVGYRDSLRLWQQLGDKKYEGLVLMNMGIIAYELQDYDEATVHLHQAAAALKEAGASEWLAMVQNELGLVYRDQGKWNEALAHFDAFVNQRRSEAAHDHVGLGLNNIGEVMLFQGRLLEATAALQEALQTMTTRVYRVDAHLYLGLAYQAAGELGPAQAAFQQALNLALEIGRRDFLPHVYYHLGDLLRRQGLGETALDYFLAAAKVIEETREPIQDEGLKISLLGRWQQVYEILVLQLLALGRAEEAYVWAERARARAFAEALAQDRAIEAHTEKEADELQEVVTIPDIQAALPLGAVLLCYFTTGVLARELPMLRAITADNPLRDHLLTPARTILFVVTNDQLNIRDCAVDPNAFVIASPRGRDPERFLTQQARQRLYTALIEPARVASSTRQLIIIPHGPLHHVPFNALVDPDGRSLVHAGGPTLSYAPSATVLWQHCLAKPHHQPGAIRNSLAIGYNARRGQDALRYTEAEVIAVAELTGGEMWTGKASKKDRLRNVAIQQRYLHFACHGWFNHEHPLESYLETGEGERLTAREVMETWRLQAELVTLSACLTGVSRYLRGDEPMGLVRAFLYAGARAVLVTQWPVADLAAFLLMLRFYTELQRDDVVLATALHKAQRWLCRLTVVEVREVMASLPAIIPRPDMLAGLPQDHRLFTHPRFWAAFTLVGGL